MNRLTALAGALPQPPQPRNNELGDQAASYAVDRYLFRLDHCLVALTGRLLDCGADPRLLDVHGGRAARRRPAGASKFARNRHLGDWAEGRVKRALQDAGWRVRHYGEAGRLSCGEAGFSEAFAQSERRALTSGKRPDFLARNTALGGVCGVEVRASRHAFGRHEAQRRRDADDRRRLQGSHTRLAFTIKLHELVDMHRWSRVSGCPQVLVQVFIDQVFAINLLDLFERIAARPEAATPSANGLSKGRASPGLLLRVPVEPSLRVGTFEPGPTFHTSVETSHLGRHEAVLRPKGGRLRLDAARFHRIAVPGLPGRADAPSAGDTQGHDAQIRDARVREAGATYRPLRAKSAAPHRSAVSVS